MSNSAAPPRRAPRPSIDLDALASGNLDETVFDDALFEDNGELAVVRQNGSTTSIEFPAASAKRGITRQPSLDLDLAMSGQLEETADDGQHDAIFEEEVAAPRGVQFAEPVPEPEPKVQFRAMPRDRTSFEDGYGEEGTPIAAPPPARRTVSRQPSLDLDLAASGRLLEESTYFGQAASGQLEGSTHAGQDTIGEEDDWEGMAAEINSAMSHGLNSAPVLRTHTDDVRSVKEKVSSHNLVLQEDDILADLLHTNVNTVTNDGAPSQSVDNDLAVIDRYITLARDQKHDNFLLLAEADKTKSGAWDWPRYTAYKITGSTLFEIGIMVIIVANICTLALYEPTQSPTEGKNLILTKIENYFLLIYWIELILRVTADGLVNPKNTTRKAYLQQPENWLDCLIVIAGTVEYGLWMSGGRDDASGGGGGGGIAALRALRALRVMKFVKSLKSLRLVIKVLIDSLPQIMTVGICLGCIMAILAILGMQLYMGRLNSACFMNDSFEQVETRPCIKYDVDEFNVRTNSPQNPSANYCQANQTCITGMKDAFNTVPYQVPEGWPVLTASNLSIVYNGTMSFDHWGVAFYTVYTLGTMEGWTSILYAYDATGGKMFNWIYFVTVVVVQGYILVSLLIGVLTGLYVKEAELAAQSEGANEIKRQLSKGVSKAEINKKFSAMTLKRNSSMKKKSQESLLSTSELQQDFVHPGFATEEMLAAQLITKRKDTPVPFPKLKTFVGSASFKYVMMAVILANTAFLCMDCYPSTPEWDAMLQNANYIFVGLFTLELLLKLVAMTPVNFFARNMYRFDTMVVVASIIELLLVDAFKIDGQLSLSAFRALRLLRVLRISSDWHKLRMYAYGSIRAMTGLGSLGLLSFLFLTICSLVGMQIFGSTNNFWSRTNYNNFGNAFITSFQLMTAEGWNEVMYEGIEAVGGIKGWSGLSGMYFIVVVGLGNYVLLGVLLAIAYKNLSDMLPEPGPRQLSEKDLRLTLKDAQKHHEDKSMVRNDACGISYQNGIRQISHDVMHSKWFDPLILLCIMTSSILLAVEDYVNPDAARNATLKYFDYIFVAIFTFEMLIKMLALGLCMHKRSYFRSGWNILDFVIVFSSIVTLAIPQDMLNNSSLSGLIRVVRTLRVLRPLRAIEESPGLQAVVGAIIDAVVKLWGMLITALLVVLCFAICGTALFKGTFQYCNDNQITNSTLCEGNFTYMDELNHTVTANRVWKTHDLNFDYVHKSFLTLLSILQFEDWPLVYQHSVDATFKGEGPIEGNRRGMFVFYFFFLVFVCLFFINIVMAFVVLMFRNQSEALHRQTGLTRPQVLCLRYALQVPQPEDPYHMRRGNKVLKYVDTPKFEYGVLALVVGNVICMLMEYDGMSDGYRSSLDVANKVFVTLFGIEYVLKAYAFGFFGYFWDNWNRFDFIVLVGSVLDIALSATDLSISILRVFRAARLVKLLNQGDAKHLFQTCLDSLKSISFVGVIYMLILFIYSIVGMVLFARLPLDPETTINEDNNFRNVGNSALLLFRAMTGESWQAMMADSHQDPDAAFAKCVLNHTDNGGSTCGSGANQIFFVSYVILTNVLILNILVAVIVDNFEFLYMDKSELQPLHLREFGNEWKKFDPRGIGTIHHGHLLTILKKIDPPFGIGKRCPDFLAHKFLSTLHIPVDRRQHINFRPTLVGIIRARLNLWMKYTPSQEMLMRVYSVIAKNVSLEVLEDAAPPEHQSEFSVRMLYTVYRLQYIFRANRTRKLHPERIDSMALAKALAHAEVEQEERRLLILEKKLGMTELGNSDTFKRMSSKTQEQVEVYAENPDLENHEIRRMSNAIAALDSVKEEPEDYAGRRDSSGRNISRRDSVLSLTDFHFGDEERHWIDKEESYDADAVPSKRRGSLAFVLEHGHPDMLAPDVVVQADGTLVNRPESAGNKEVIKALFAADPVAFGRSDEIDLDLTGKVRLFNRGGGSQRSKADSFGFEPGTKLPATSAAKAGMNQARHNWLKAKDAVSSVKAFLTGGYMDI